MANKEYKNIVIISLKANETFSEINEKLDKIQRYNEINTLVFIKSENACYSYDYFQPANSLNDLTLISEPNHLEAIQKLPENQVQKIEASKNSLYSQLSQSYGYPENYASRISKGRLIGSAMGGIIGIGLGIAALVVIFPLALPTLLMLPILGEVLMIAMPVAVVASTMLIGFALGAIIGAGCGALAHYVEKLFVPSYESKVNHSDDSKNIETVTSPTEKASMNLTPDRTSFNSIFSADTQQEKATNDNDTLTLEAFHKGFAKFPF